MDFLNWLENSAIGTWINQSSSIVGYPGIILVHTFGLTLLVGINVFFDLRVLGFAPQIPLVELRKFVPFMWVGMVLSIVSGLLLLTAKATTMMLNPAFIAKMILIVLAVVVFFMISNKTLQDPLSDKRPAQADLRILAIVSITLWFAAITAGRLMAYVGEAAEFGALLIR